MFFSKSNIKLDSKFIIKLHYIYIKNIEKKQKNHKHYHTNKHTKQQQVFNEACGTRAHF